MTRDLDVTELKWSGGQTGAPPPSSNVNPDASRGKGWGSTEVVLVEGAVVALLVMTCLVYANGAGDAEKVADEAQDGKNPDNAHDAHSTESEP